MRLGSLVTGCGECGTVYEVDPAAPHVCELAPNLHPEGAIR